MDHFSQRTMVFLGVRGDARDNSSAETLEVSVELVVASVVAPAKAHYLKASSSHCDLTGESLLWLLAAEEATKEHNDMSIRRRKKRKKKKVRLVTVVADVSAVNDSNDSHI